MSDTSLNKKLQAALSSRDSRSIRRRLPPPTALSTPSLIDFTTNDYLSLSTSPLLRSSFLQKLSKSKDILGSGGSRLLVNTTTHDSFEKRLNEFFGGEAALLFNSGFDANVGFFASVPQPGDVIVYDEYVHASVHDGMRASRVQRNAMYPFKHNDVASLRRVLERVRREHPQEGKSVFVSVESLYSMDGTFAPLEEMVEVLEVEGKNAHLVVDEAHATGIYGPLGRGRVAELGLEDKVLARLHTFGKALAATGAVIITTQLIRDYLLNYARSLIYTTSLSNANIIAADCSFDLLTNGTASHLSTKLLSLSTHFTSYLHPKLLHSQIPPSLLSLPSHALLSPSLQNPPSPIIPILTPHPRPLSAYLNGLGMRALPITWPTVPKGKERVRICLHSGNTREEVEKLADGIIEWARALVVVEEEGEEKYKEKKNGRVEREQGLVVASKL